MRNHASDHNSRPLGPAILLALALLIATAIAPLRAQQSNPAVPPAASQTAFIENRGQWDPSAQFLVQTPGLDAWITAGGVVYDVYRHESVGEEKGSLQGLSVGSGNEHPFDGTPMADAFGPDQPATNRIGHVVRMQFEGARPTTRLVGVDRQPGVYNYFIGNDRSKWATDVRRYSGVRVENLYEGIDAVYYLDEGRPRYDLVVAPGADAGRIRMAFTGAEHLSVAGDGALEITTSMGVLRQQGLFAYQEIGGVKKQIACDFVAGADGTVRFEVGEYDRSRALVVDPLVWSTFIGGGGNDFAFFTGLALDSSGYAYIAGYTLSTDFPVTNGAYDEGHNGGQDAFVSKFESDGSSLIYSTVIGGDHNDWGTGLAVDINGSTYLTGQTYSSDYPTTSGAFDNMISSGPDALITKLSANGGVIEYSTFLGGNGYDFGFNITVDSNGDAFVVGRTLSADFPTTSGTYDGSFNGSMDIFFTKVNSSGSSLLYSSYLGGAGADEGYSIRPDGTGGLYIIGRTTSPDFPTTSTAFDQSHNGNFDAFIARIDPENSTLEYSTFLGGTGLDYAIDARIDGDGNAYLTGQTSSLDFPTTSGAFDASYNGNTDIFVAKLNLNTYQLSFSTFVGAGSADFAYGIALSSAGDAFIAGRTASPDFPVTGDAFDGSHNGNNDAFLIKVAADGTVPYASFFGGTGYDEARSIELDAAGNVFFAGQTSSSGFPVTSGAYDISYNGAVDGFLSKVGYPSIDLTSPNGSQSWCAGTSQTLTWTSTAITDVKIELSDDAGSTWSEIVASTPAAGGSYSWAIPATQAGGSNYRIRVSDASASAVNDASDADFTINAAPGITAQPSDQVVVAGSTATFTVATSATATVQWQSSTDGGTSWSDLSGATSTTYSLTAAIAGSGTQYRAVFDNGTCTSRTDPATLTVKVSATDLGPAVIFLGVTDNGDNNRALDLKVELYRNGVLISSGELTDERVMGTQLNNSRKYTVPLTMTGSSVDFSATDVLSVVVSARRNGGDDDFDAVLWYDASTSQSINHGNKGWSRVGNETEGGTSTGYYYLRSSSALNGSSGTSGTTVQRSLGTTWVEFGTWSMYGAQMKSVTNGPAVTGTLSAVLIPNPSDGDIVTLRLSQGADQEVSISVVDATGRIVMAERIENARSQGDAGIPINTGDLPSGTYLVIIRSGEESIVRRLTVVR